MKARILVYVLSLMLVFTSVNVFAKNKTTLANKSAKQVTVSDTGKVTNSKMKSSKKHHRKHKSHVEPTAKKTLK